MIILSLILSSFFPFFLLVSCSHPPLLLPSSLSCPSFFSQLIYSNVLSNFFVLASYLIVKVVCCKKVRNLGKITHLCAQYQSFVSMCFKVFQRSSITENETQPITTINSITIPTWLILRACPECTGQALPAQCSLPVCTMLTLWLPC